ncbi:MAG: glycosyltransferase [Alphaproteobacteria bacterium]|nr:MAG: glycosyltransferase [Alphaproteobacteria bacterium]
MNSETSQNSAVYVFAHNEAAGIRKSIESILSQDRTNRIDIHVINNGSTDNTSDIVLDLAQHYPNIFLHNLAIGDKCNAWNFAVHSLSERYSSHIFMDGDVQISPNGLERLLNSIAENPSLNAFSAIPYSGRTRAKQIAEMIRHPGVAGNLYGLSDQFVIGLRTRHVSLPIGLVGDDSLVGALAATDLGRISDWQTDRIKVLQEVGFQFDSISIFSIRDLSHQFKRMFRYSRRHLENRILNLFLAKNIPDQLPKNVNILHKLYADQIHVTWRGMNTIFDLIELAKIRKGLPLDRDEMQKIN